MSNSFLWHDAKIEKPTTFDPVLGLTSNGYIVIVQYDSTKNIGQWFELANSETYDDVVWWSDFKLPSTWEMSDTYYDNDPYWK